jgi:hypothetical protein
MSAATALLLIYTWNRILISSIRNLGLCPCPRCLIPLNRVHNLGMIRDMNQRKTLARVDDIHRQSKITAARRVIYEKHYQVDSAAVENLLREESWVPNAVCIYKYFYCVNSSQALQNAFSDRLSPLGFNLFKMLLPDLMHEIELGIWRAIFIHLLRILESVSADRLMELDRR